MTDNAHDSMNARATGDQTPGPMIGIPAASGPTVIRTVCGAAAAYRRSRRGTFLVLVIGVLALISAFMVIYVAVGRADQQLSASVQRSAVGLADAPDGRAGESYRDSVGEKFAKYAAQIIADDSVATSYSSSAERAISPDGKPVKDNPIRLSREASDYPSMDWNRNSEALLSVMPGQYFDPVGTYRLEMGTANVPDAWAPTDPWLASSEPVWLNYDAIDDAAGAFREYRLRRDWAQISNVAPDGQFVNLYNLRRTNFIGDFEADHVKMRKDLYLYSETDTPVKKTDFGKVPDEKFPAFWTMRQRGAAIPRGAQVLDLSPGAVTYRPYEWADADGDGIYDARWFEMVDPRGKDVYDPAKSSDVLGIGGGKFRYFFATRIVDLSSRINVNFACDFASPPDSAGKYPVGLTPADIDLLRLLGLQDAWLENQDKVYNSPDKHLAYDALAQNSSTDDFTAQNYLGYDITSTANPLTALIANRSYLSMGITIDRGTIAGLTDVNQAGQTRFGDNNSTSGAQKRSDYYMLMASGSDGIIEHTTGNNAYDKTVIKSPFNVSDLVELLGRNGVNDPTCTSTLEGAAGAKYEGSDPEKYLRYSPLRDNRPLALELLNVADGNFTVGRERQIYAQLAVDVRHNITPLSGARPFKNGDVPVVKNASTGQWELSADQLTTAELKSSWPIVPARRADDQEVDLVNMAKIDNGIYEYWRAPRLDLWSTYFGALCPAAADDRTWPVNAATFAKYRYMNYGYRSPAISAVLAAQMTVNSTGSILRNGKDSGISEQPLPLTIPTTQTFGGTLAKGDGLFVDVASVTMFSHFPNPADSTSWTRWAHVKFKDHASRTYRWSTLPASIQAMERDVNLLMDSMGIDAKDDVARKQFFMEEIDRRLGFSRLFPKDAAQSGNELGEDAVVAGGAGPQPFITSAGSFTIYTDSKGTKDDADDMPDKTTATEVEINGTRSVGSANNSDYIGSIFAVQMVNPYTRDIQLNGPTTDQKRFQFYVEFNGRFYRPTDSGGNPIDVTLKPGESCVCYFTSLDGNLTEMDNRLKAAVDTGAGAKTVPAGTMNAWLTAQFNPGDSLGHPPVLMGEFNPESGLRAADDTTYTRKAKPDEFAKHLLPQASSGDGHVHIPVPTATISEVRLWRAAREPGSGVQNGTDGEIGQWLDTKGTPDTTDDEIKTELRFPQRIENDVLVDRLRDPNPDITKGENQGTWYQAAEFGLHKVPLTSGWDYKVAGGDSKDNDNRASGMTFTLAGFVCRQGDEKGQELIPSSKVAGMLPAFCVESAFKNTTLKNYWFRNAKSHIVQNARLADLSKSLWANERSGGAQAMYKDDKYFQHCWTDFQIGAPDGPMLRPLGQVPWKWNLVLSATAGADGRGYTDVADSAVQMPAEPQLHRSFDSIRPMMDAPMRYGRKAGQAVQGRAADSLLPVGVGSLFTYRKGDKKIEEMSPAQFAPLWLTPSESWALALNYEYKNSTLANDKRWKSYADFGESSPTATPPVFPVTDGGRLVIEPTYTDPANPSTGTLLSNAFIPFVDQDGDGRFDRISAGPREDVSLGLTPAMAIVEQFTALPTPAVRSLQVAQKGLVNIDTATRMVMRMLPMLSPTPDQTSNFRFWWDQTGNSSKLDPSVDLAASVLAYRDKGWIRRRPDAADASTPGQPIAFDDRDQAGNPKTDPTKDDEFKNGRGGRSELTGIRERPGLIAASEIMGVTRRYDRPNAGIIVKPDDKANIDFPGWDVGSMASGGSNRMNASTKGVGSIDYSDADGVKQLYEIYEDKLLVPNAVLNSVTTRSDYFAVWFVVAGFKASDVRGLSNTTPLVPSIQRRYVMVVDRSNVVKKGDRPRIVFFREVPM